MNISEFLPPANKPWNNAVPAIFPRLKTLSLSLKP